MDLETLHKSLQYSVQQLKFEGNPAELYDPINYFLSLGGKRMRPMLALLSFNLWKDHPEQIMKPALALEVFHNFTLLHDDIMDKAPVRRGKATVHTQWNENIAILSGDLMFIFSYELLMSQHRHPELLSRFNQCAREVCEGQQLDMNFESRDMVSESEYLDMIRLKTAVLLGFSMELGAILAEATEQEKRLVRQFGEDIGMGFQLSDDLLDVYADQEKFGKQVGGDIIANKKTFLLIHAWQEANMDKKAQLEYWLKQTQFDPKQKVASVKKLYDELHVREATEQKIKSYFDDGFQCLEKLQVDELRKKLLIKYTHQLLKRAK